MNYLKPLNTKKNKLSTKILAPRMFEFAQLSDHNMERLINILNPLDLNPKCLKCLEKQQRYTKNKIHIIKLTEYTDMLM